MKLDYYTPPRRTRRRWLIVTFLALLAAAASALFAYTRQEPDVPVHVTNLVPELEP